MGSPLLVVCHFGNLGILGIPAFPLLFELVTRIGVIAHKGTAIPRAPLRVGADAKMGNKPYGLSLSSHNSPFFEVPCAQYAQKTS